MTNRERWAILVRRNDMTKDVEVWKYLFRKWSTDRSMYETGRGWQSKLASLSVVVGLLQGLVLIL